jgi:2-polyprenyl-3-methyl-5-hydroxy-6-metoxy-1,4-benzoquinol methylase
MIKRYCANRKILDVGCIGQDAGFNSDKWLHNVIRQVASEVTGVDISTENIAKLNQQGYRVFHPTELKERPETFDIIVMADVIEHVDDPVGFLKFYAEFLNSTGIMLISTPNANRAVNFFSILAFDNYSVNDEHTCWFCPKTLQEVVLRAGLQLKEFYWLKRYYPTKGMPFISRMLTCLSDGMALWRKNFNQNFMFIVSK